MTRRTVVLSLFIGAYLAGSRPSDPLHPRTDRVAPRTNLLAKLPLRFEEARGPDAGVQGVQYVARGPNYQLAIAPSENRLTVRAPQSQPVTIQTKLVGANPVAPVDGMEPLGASTNYFRGASESEWRTGVRNYGRVRVQSVYPGIDLIFYGSASTLEYDFVVNAGADPEQIECEIAGAEQIQVDGDGALLLATSAGEIRWKKPVVYQESGHGREEIPASFEVAANQRVRFHLGNYDPTRALVIDPVLSYATYVGGKGNDIGAAIGTDGTGNVYIAGLTTSMDLAVTRGAFQTAYGGETLEYTAGDAFVAKFSPSGTLLYLTYVGGQGDDYANALAVDAAGNAYITGVTNSSDFPVTAGVLQPTFGGFGGNKCLRPGDAFVAKLNPNGTQLLYSTYLGGGADDGGVAIAIDSSGNAYVAGATLSVNFPVTAGVVQPRGAGAGGQTGRPSCGGEPYLITGDAFVAKINASGSQLLFSTFLGGSQDDLATSIALDSSQNVYVAGATLSSNFPTTNGAIQRRYGGVDSQNQFFHVGDGFVTKLNSTATAIVYSTYLGGNGEDGVAALTVDSAGTAYVTGATSSIDFPTTENALQRTYKGFLVLPFLVEQNIGDAFVARLNATGTALLYSTYFGGSANDAGQGIGVNATGQIFVSGRTDSADFPVTADATQRFFAGDSVRTDLTYSPEGDGFLAIIDPTASKPVFSTYSGGDADDAFYGVAFDASGNVWVTGGTLSASFPITSNAAQRAYAGRRARQFPGDALLLKYSGFGPTVPAVQSIVNAASNASGVVSPGMVFVGYGSNLGPATLVGSAVDPATGLLSTSRAGVSILFDNVPSPIVYVSATQIAGTVPYAVASKTTSQVVVVVNDQRSVPFTVQVAPAAPGLFTKDFSGKGEAVIYNQDNTLNSPSNPAAKGSIIQIYATGEGQTDPLGQDGKFATSVFPKPVLPVRVFVGGVVSPQLPYAGALPGAPPGILQVNAVVPDLTPSGAQPVVLQIGTFSSQAQTTVSIR